LPVVADQHHLGVRLLGVLQQATQLTTTHHAGLIHDQHRPGVQLLPAAVQVAQQPVAGGHVLEPLPLQAHGGDPSWGCGQEPVAVQLPSMAGYAQREGLAGPGPPDHQGNAGAALAHIPDHPGLVLWPVVGCVASASPTA
jgi:hypothetical protein